METNLGLELKELEERCTVLIKRNAHICQRGEALSYLRNALILRFQSTQGGTLRSDKLQEIETLLNYYSDKKAELLNEPTFESFLRKVIGIYNHLSVLHGADNPLNRLITTNVSDEMGPYARIRGLIAQQESLLPRQEELMDLEEGALVKIAELLAPLGENGVLSDQ